MIALIIPWKFKWLTDNKQIQHSEWVKRSSDDFEYPEKPSKVTDMIESLRPFTSGSSKF